MRGLADIIHSITLYFMEDKKIRVAITHGDTNSIGYEIIFKAFADPAMLELCTPIIYGSPKVAAYHRKAMDLQANFTIINSAEGARDGRVNLLTTFDDEVKVEMGQPTAESGYAALCAIVSALEDYKKGRFDVLVTAPVTASNITTDEHPFTSQASFLARSLGSTPTEMLVNEKLRVALATVDTPLADVSREVNKQLIAERATAVQHALKRDFCISNPRIAVLALNPVVGQEYAQGSEETEIIQPAISELKAAGIQAFGPYPADDFFARADYEVFDAVLAMYHDQGTIPFKLLGGDEAVCYTAGLPMVHTQPGHGPAFDIAGQNKASESQLRQAIYLAIDVFRARAHYDEPLADPLPKLYREKRDESEKVRFSIPKKKEAKA